MRRPDLGSRWSVGTFATSVIITFGVIQMLERGLLKTAHSFKRVRAPTCDRWRPGWSRCFSGKKLIAGRHDLEACIEQPPQDDPGRPTRIHDDDRKICGSEQVFEHLLRGELAHCSCPRSISPCHAA